MEIEAKVLVVSERAKEGIELFSGARATIEVGIPRGRLHAKGPGGDFAYLRLFTDSLFEPDVIVPAQGGRWAIVPGRTTTQQRVDWHLFADSVGDEVFEQFLTALEDQRCGIVRVPPTQY